jgi:hypothetical protein
MVAKVIIKSVIAVGSGFSNHISPKVIGSVYNKRKQKSIGNLSNLLLNYKSGKFLEVDIS